MSRSITRRLSGMMGRSESKDENGLPFERKSSKESSKSSRSGTGACRRGPFADLTNGAFRGKDLRGADREREEEERKARDEQREEQRERDELKRQLREQEAKEEQRERDELKRHLREVEAREATERERKATADKAERELQARASLRDSKNWIAALHPVDQPVAKDIRYVAEYVEDCIENMRLQELRQPGVAVDFLAGQEVISDKMRSILIDWLVEVHLKFKLGPETIFLTVGLLDRVLAARPIARNELQLIGVTCLLIAAKYVEVYAPEIRDFVSITDHAYTRRQILDMEVTVLTALRFKLTLPSPLVFMRRFCRLLEGEQQLEYLAQYILELSLVDHRMVRYAPSHLASASLLLANKVMKKSEAWPAGLCRASHTTEQSLRPCAKELCALLQGAEKSSLQAVRKKFSAEKYLSVAKLLTP